MENKLVQADQPSLSANRKLTALVWQLAAPFLFFLGMLQFFPYWKSIWLVNDEGYNLMKAMLVERGYTLYSQIWSDQAPLLTYLLAGLFRLVGNNVDLSRKMILIFSCVLLWAVFQYLHLTWGKLHALIGAVLVVFVPNFLVVSSAVLVGQPSLTFAMLSMLALAEWHLRRKSIYCILSAIAMSLSLLAKLYTGFLVPIFMIGLLAAEFFQSTTRKDWLAVIRPTIIWGAACLVVTFTLGILMINPANVAQLVQPHVSAALSTEYPLNEQLQPINYYLLPAWPILLAAIFGAFVAWKRRRWLAAYPLAWMVVAYLFLLIDKPVWWHHTLLITVPASILAAGGIGESIKVLVEGFKDHSKLKNSWGFIAAGLTSVALICALSVPETASFLINGNLVNAEETHHAEEKILNKIVQFAPQTHWMVTDMPMLPFIAGLKVPPELTVLSWKRFAAGDLTESTILHTLQELHPEQVLLGRFSLPSIDRYLLENYRVIYQRGTTILYVRNDLQK